MDLVYVFRSTDGGSTWSYYAQTFDIGVNSISFVTRSRWLQINNDGSVRETTDAGKNWHSFATDYMDSSGVPNVFVFGDERIGYGTVRGGIHRTVDGGAHWVTITTPGTVPPIGGSIPMPTTAQLSAASGNVIWASVGGFLFRSTDRGDSWEQRTLPPAIGGGGVPEVSFVDDRQGWFLHPGVPATQCSGAGAEIWRTTDGAATWQRVAYVDQQTQGQGLAFSQCKESLSFVDSTHGFVAAGDGNYSPTIYRTADGGKTWAGSKLPDPPDFKTQGGFALRAGPVKRFGNTLYLQAWGKQGGDIPDRQYIFRSTDGGATWLWVTKIPSRYIVMVTEARWLQLVVPGQSMESTTSGQQWHPYASDFNTDTPVGGPQIVFADSQVGYAEGRGALQRTVDGGLHWVRITTPGT
jgi:photosystem II stability/assembly factor-like uncharacterized protein